MTVHRLSAQSVKVQLSADELKLFLNDADPSAESPQMLRLIAHMLAKAESVSGIPFSALPVTVELLTAPQGGLTAYFTAQTGCSTVPAKAAKPVRTAAGFGDPETLRRCCMQLERRKSEIQSSALYAVSGGYILTLKFSRTHSGCLHHILLEYGSPFRLTALNRARLHEYAVCICEQDAVSEVCRNYSPRSSRTASAGDAAPSR